MDNSGTPMPDFERPPVVETVLSVEFAPLQNWGIPHFGLFWSELREEFPEFQVQPPLGSQIERSATEDLAGQDAILQVSAVPRVRCWFMHREKNSLIQVQDNHFAFNWRKIGEGDSYPRYEKIIRPHFLSCWGRFREFVRAQAIGEIEVLQAEVTYVNHLPIGEGWESVSDLPSVFPEWSGMTSGDFLPAPERAYFGVNYAMPNAQGRLRVTLQPALRSVDAKEVLQLTLTARGRPTTSDPDSVSQWLDMGREWVVRGFKDFTSRKMHALWKLTN